MLDVVNLNVDGDIDVGGKIEFFEFVDCLGCGFDDVDEVFVSV